MLVKLIERVASGSALVGATIWLLWPGKSWSPDPEPALMVLVCFFTWIGLEIRHSIVAESADRKGEKLPIPEEFSSYSIVLGSHHEGGVNLWEASGLVGTSDAIAAGRILGYISALGGKDCEVVAAHNYPGNRLDRNLILIGGPDANILTKEIIEKLPLNFQIGVPDTHVISIIDNNNNEYFNPTINPDDTVVKDHGVVIRARNPFNTKTRIFVVAGSFGQGTLAASLFMCEQDLIRCEKFSSYEFFESIVVSDVVDNWPQEPNLIRVYPVQ